MEEQEGWSICGGVGEGAMVIRGGDEGCWWKENRKKNKKRSEISGLYPWFLIQLQGRNPALVSVLTRRQRVRSGCKFEHGDGARLGVLVKP